MSQKYRRKQKNNDELSAIPANYKIVIVISAIVIVALVHYFVNTKRQIEIRDTGYRVNALRHEIQKERTLNSKLHAKLAELKKLDRVIKKLKNYGIVLTVPPIEKVYRVKLYDGIEGIGKSINKAHKHGG